MLEAKIIQINRQINKIYVRFVISDEDNERVLVFWEDATSQNIQDSIKSILTDLNYIEEKKNELKTELQDLVITL